MSRIIVDVGKQMTGATFQLSPQTRVMLASRKLGLPPISSVFVAFDTKKAFDEKLGPIWVHVVMILTGLTEDQLEELGGYSFVSPADQEVLFESRAA